MINLNVPSGQASSGFMAELYALGLFVTHKDAELWVDGDAEQEAQAVALAASFDHAAGVFADASKRYEAAVQAHLDAGAQAVGYDSILSACSYAAYTNPFQAEGQSFVVWRGDVWSYCYAQLSAVQAGTRPQPSVEELIAELPVRT